LTATPQIELRPIESLIFYARNARTHSPEQINQIKASLIEFGWTNCVLADQQGIVAGHGRVMAASELYQHQKQIKFPSGDPIPLGMVPVVDCTGWTPAQRQAYIIADNKLALNAGWDDNLLSLELAELKSENFNLDLTGFNPDELNELLGCADLNAAEADPDDAPDIQEQTVSVPGDVWVLGAHRVLCGSSLDIAAWDSLMAGEKADICWTDPPYNVAYEGNAGRIKNDDMSDNDFRQFLLDAFAGVMSALKPGAPVYVAHADGQPGEAFRYAFRQSGLKLSGALIWRKNQFTLSRSDYQWQHESILYGWKPGSKHRWYGGRKLTTMMEMGDGSPFTRLEDGRWAVRVGDSVLVVTGDASIEDHPSSIIFHDKPQRSAQHPTMKPVGLIEKMLRASARSGDIVIDGFGGSGSTLIAADRMGMSARLIELDARFVDVIVRRWQSWSGRRAVHAVTGIKFQD
jgi:DNA modification methylase